MWMFMGLRGKEASNDSGVTKNAIFSHFGRMYTPNL